MGYQRHQQVGLQQEQSQQGQTQPSRPHHITRDLLSAAMPLVLLCEQGGASLAFACMPLRRAQAQLSRIQSSAACLLACSLQASHSVIT